MPTERKRKTSKKKLMPTKAKRERPARKYLDLTVAEATYLEAAIKASGMRQGEWLRKAALDAATIQAKGVAPGVVSELVSLLPDIVEAVREGNFSTDELARRDNWEKNHVHPKVRDKLKDKRRASTGVLSELAGIE